MTLKQQIDIVKHTAIDDDGIEREIVTRKEALARGDKFYFTGKRCKRGHLSLRVASKASSCISCDREYEKCEKRRAYNKKRRNTKEWKEYHSNYNKQWELEHIDERRMQKKQDRADNPEKYKRKRRSRYEENIEREKEWSKKYAQTKKGREVRRKAVLKYIRTQNGMLKRRIYCRHRRGQKKFITHNFTTSDELRLLDLQGLKCACCKKSFILKTVCARQKNSNCGSCKRIKPENLQNYKGKLCYHVDHIIALAKAEEYKKMVYNFYDFQLLCPSCNLEKKTKDNLDYLQQQERNKVKVLI